jgi:hypothetical protein
MADLRKVARQKAEKYGLDPNIFVRQINQESGFQTRISSPAGAQGIAQIMPGTARAWGVNPNDPVAALDAAARNMASYVKKYGSYENALRAYNAGAGAIQKSKNYGETNHYVKVILQGRDPGKLNKPGRSAGGSTGRSSSGGSTTTTVKTPGTTRLQQTESTSFDQEGYDRAVKLSQLKSVLSGFKGGRSTSLLQSVLPDAADPAAFTRTQTGVRTVKTPGSTVTTTTRNGSTRAPSSGGGNNGVKVPGLKGKGSGLFELIYNDGGKGYGVKNNKIVDGRSVFSGVWAGHANHVHAAAGPKTIVALGKLAQQMGLHVGENSHFGGVDVGAHVPGSYHGKDEAIDVSAPMTPAGKALMKKYAAAVQRYYFGR